MKYPEPKCGPNCGHSYSEHRAFDKAVIWGRKYGLKATNPWDSIKNPKEYAACEVGISLGAIEELEKEK
jgi:hypothetical protein